MKLLENLRGLAAMSLLAGTAALVFCGCDKAIEKENNSETQAAETAVSETEETVVSETEDPGIAFPYELEDGKLSVKSLFTSDLMNPDCNNEEAEGIASLEITNQSDTCMTQGVFTVTTTDGTVIPFTITCLPAGETAWAFASDNTTLADIENPCESIEDDVTFTAEDILMSNTLQISAEGSTVTLTNISGTDQANITVYCHDTMDDTIYGGITYTYTVDYLSAGETTTIDAADCWLGTAEVVYVSVGE